MSLVLPLIAWSLAPPWTVVAQEPPAEPSRLSLARIIDSDNFPEEGMGAVRWLPDGSGYLSVEAGEGGKGQQVVKHAPADDARTVLVRADQLVPEGAKDPIWVESFSISRDGGKLLIFTKSQRVWRANTRGDYWVFSLADGKPRKLGGDAPESSLMFAEFNPDATRVAYVRANNLYVENLSDGQIVALTSDGSPTTINGTFDWVYEEELALRNGFRWSPDGKSIAYWQIDSSGVSEYLMLDTTSELYPKVVKIPYPKVGQQNPAARVGVVSADGGETRWLDIPGDPRQNYIVRMEWVPESNRLLIRHLNRRQDTLRLLLADPATGAIEELLTDHDDAWVDVTDDLRWFDQGRAFLWTADRDGWRRLEVVRLGQEGQPKRLTPGDFDVISVVCVDEKNATAYFMASPDNPTQSYLYSVPLDGSRPPARVTPLDQAGTHDYRFSPDAVWAIHTYSSFGRPPITELVAMPGHQVVRMLVGNAKLRTALDALEGDRGEFFRVEIENGVILDGWCIKPSGFDPAKKYPLLVHVYGEPAGQTVVDHWGGDTYLWHRMLAQQGYFVVSIDNRGTPAPRGHDWRKCVYGQIGILAPRDQAEALKKLEARWPYIDRDRVGIWGWSGGGSMTLDCLFRYPDVYKLGIAIAFVADQRFYDTIYQERYMGLPTDNPNGYKDGSPVTHAEGLKGKLLLIHGTGDDNVHFQNFETLVNRLIALGKPFSMMAYPNRSHGIYEGDGTRRHLYELMTNYLLNAMPPGPRP